jgi:hypothetical protein
VVGLEVDAEMRPHPERGKPRVEKRREASRLVLIEEQRISRLAGSAHLRESLHEQVERLVPADTRPLRTALYHRAAEAIGIVQALWGGLPTRAQRTTVGWMCRISFQLDNVPVAGLGDYPACRGAFAAGCCVVVGDAGNGLVGRDQIGDEFADLLGAATDRRNSRARDAHDLEKVAALEGWARGFVAHFGWFR